MDGGYSPAGHANGVGCGFGEEPAMPTLSYSVRVPYPPDVVFDFVANAENNPKWHAHVNETHWVDDREIGLGRAARQTGHLWGRDWVLEARIVEWDPPNLVTYETTKGPKARTTLRVAPASAAARLSLTVKTGPSLGPLDRPVSRLMERLTANRGRGDVER